MSKHFIVSNLLIIVIGLMSLPVSRAGISIQGSSIKTSVYRDDPFVAESCIGRVDASSCSLDSSGHPLMSGERVSMINESVIYRKDANGNFVGFVWNPWPQESTSNEKGNFKFADELRFPLDQPERDADGKIVMRDGLRVWKALDHHLGINTAFAASHATRDQLTDGRASDAPLLDNQGVLTFRSDGTLADDYSPLPLDAVSHMRAQVNVQAMTLVNQARQFGLDLRGGLLSIGRRPDGQLTVEARG